MKSTLAPFRSRSYRFQWPADLLTSWALEMEFLILGWYVLVETGSVVLLTLFGALQHGGTLIAPILGVVSDRIGPRNLLTGMRMIYATIATTLMTLAFAGALTPVIVLVLVALMGLVRPSDLGLRSALIADTMPHEQLTGSNHVSLLNEKLRHYTPIKVLDDVRLGLCSHRRRRNHRTVDRCDRSPSA